MGDSLQEAGLDPVRLAKARRVQQVRNIWSQLVEQVILDHTNAVYIFDNEGAREMHVYVDDSIFAAELNNRRELLVMLCKQQFNEDVDKLLFHVSYGQRKSEYPFRREQSQTRPERPLSSTEQEYVEKVAQGIEDEALKEKFRKAMISDLKRSGS